MIEGRLIGVVEMGRFVVWLKVNGRMVTKEVEAGSSEKAKEIAVKESSWFGGKVEVISVTAVGGK